MGIGNSRLFKLKDLKVPSVVCICCQSQFPESPKDFTDYYAQEPKDESEKDPTGSSKGESGEGGESGHRLVEEYFLSKINLKLGVPIAFLVISGKGKLR